MPKSFILEGGELRLAPENFGENSFVTIVSDAELNEYKDRLSYYKELPHDFSSIRYCKAEMFKDCIIGTLRLPHKGMQRSAQLSFAFYMTQQSLLLIEGAGNLKQWIEKRINMVKDVHRPEELLLFLMEQMIVEDVLYLSNIELETEKMEESIISDKSSDFFTLLTKYRQKLSELNIYYEQMIDIGEMFQSPSCSEYDMDVKIWEKFAARAERLQNHVHLLSENMLQLRELYQSRQESRNNKIMGILTVVTTFFLPLTLITGWYGMNFVNMPELRWRYGYLVVIIVSILIAIGEYIYFKRKKYF